MIDGEMAHFVTGNAGMYHGMCLIGGDLFRSLMTPPFRIRRPQRIFSKPALVYTVLTQVPILCSLLPMLCRPQTVS